MKEKSDKINHFLLQEQFPDIIKVAGTDKRSSNSCSSKFSSAGTVSSSTTPAALSFPKHSVSKRIVTAVDHVTQLRLESCRCPHFEEYLPRILDLTVCRTTPNQRHPRGWAFANPVHALHMVASQSGTETSSKTQKQRLPPTFLYGEEQHRTTALQTEGIGEYWCSFDGNSPDTTYAIQQQMDVINSSKFIVRPTPKLMKDGPIVSQSHQRSASSTEINPTKLTEPTQETLQPLDIASSATAPAQPVTGLMERATSAIPSVSQDSTLIGTANHVSIASACPKLEPAQQKSTSNVREVILLHNSVTDPSIAIGKNSALQSESGPPTSDPAPQSATSNTDVVSGDSRIEEENETIKNDLTGTGKAILSIETTSITASETSPTNINLTSTTNTSPEMGSNNDSSSDIKSVRSEINKVSAVTIDEKGERKKTTIEIVKNEHHKSDSSLSQLPEQTKNAEDSLVTPLDASSSSSIAAATLTGVDCTNNEETGKIESIMKDRIESSHLKLSSALGSKDEYSAVNDLGKDNQIIEGIQLESKELAIVGNQKVAKSNITIEKAHTPALLLQSHIANTNDTQIEVKVDADVTKKDKINSGRIDSAKKIKSMSQDADFIERKKDEVNKESLPISKIGTEKVITNSKTKISGDTTMQSNDTDPDIVEATTKTNLKDDPMEDEETVIGVKVQETTKEGSTTNGRNQKVVADSSSKESNFDQKDLKAVEVDNITPSTQSRPSTMTITATGIVVAASIKSNAATSMQQQVRPQILTTPFKSDPSMDHFRREEEKIRRARRSLTAKRVRKKSDSSIKDVSKKKRRVSEKSHVIPGWKTPSIGELNSEEEEEYMDVQQTANERVERWIRQFRLCQESFWDERESQKGLQKLQNNFSIKLDLAIKKPCCQWCDTDEEEKLMCRRAKSPSKTNRPFIGDELMQCLDCGFIGCSPPSLNSDTNQHMQQHLLISGHKFAVSCGEKAQLFCFECGDCVYHEVFEQEKIRIACARKIPHMAWKEHAVLRSFDPFQFLKTPDSGILWRGLVATYPPMVPKEHFCAAQLTLRRQALFEGSSHENWILPKSNALYFAALQHLKTDEERFKISAPVGIYNLGNTCFISSILQCLVFCKPLQQYFLRDSGHHYKSCEMFRHKEDLLTAAAASAAVAPTKKMSAKFKKPGNSSAIKKKTSKIEPEVCLACEMDRLFLSYYGGAAGNDVFVPIEESSQHLFLRHSDASPSFSPSGVVVPIEKGDPLIISDLLTSAWKSGGMNHLTGYDQHDAHEFLDSFLDVLGKHTVKFRKRIHNAVTKVYKENAFVPRMDCREVNIIKNLFEGSLRSVLLCENCGVKRVQQEPFMNISLSLSEQVERMQEGKGTPKCDLSLETCLQHFVHPEILGDLVHCNSCKKKTRTKKQHTFAKLPKILCLHLKRFDAAKNKKIENFVSFPSHNLNMGVLLSHWCEVTRLGSSEGNKEGSIPTAKPKILYDLFGTVNHIGNMQSGHYVANVKVDNTWYHCNDQHVSYIKEESVLKAEGAYVLFYIRH